MARPGRGIDEEVLRAEAERLESVNTISYVRRNAPEQKEFKELCTAIVNDTELARREQERKEDRGAFCPSAEWVYRTMDGFWHNRYKARITGTLSIAYKDPGVLELIQAVIMFDAIKAYAGWYVDVTGLPQIHAHWTDEFGRQWTNESRNQVGREFIARFKRDFLSGRFEVGADRARTNLYFQTTSWVCLQEVTAMFDRWWNATVEAEMARIEAQQPNYESAPAAASFRKKRTGKPAKKAVKPTRTKPKSKNGGKASRGKP